MSLAKVSVVIGACVIGFFVITKCSSDNTRRETDITDSIMGTDMSDQFEAKPAVSQHLLVNVDGEAAVYQGTSREALQAQQSEQERRQLAHLSRLDQRFRESDTNIAHARFDGIVKRDELSHKMNAERISNAVLAGTEATGKIKKNIEVQLEHVVGLSETDKKKSEAQLRAAEASAAERMVEIEKNLEISMQKVHQMNHANKELGIK